MRVDPPDTQGLFCTIAHECSTHCNGAAGDAWACAHLGEGFTCAPTPPPTCIPNPSAPGTTPGGGAAAGGGTTAGSSATLENPLHTTDLAALIGRVIRGLTGVVGALALLMFVVGGILWMTAGGNDEQMKTAKSMLVNSTLGLLIIFFAFTLISAFLNLFSG